MKIQEEDSNELIILPICGHEDNSLAAQGALKVYKYEKGKYQVQRNQRIDQI